MNNLSLYGWNNHLSQQKQSSQFSSLLHGRVTVVHRTCYDVVAEDGFYQCELTGNMLYGKSPEEFPCTGDWVLFQPMEQDKGVILDVMPREKTLYRKKIGTTSGKQAIAAHVDKAFIVQSLDANFNVRRTERFMVQIMEEGIEPVIVLTKADLEYDKEIVEDTLKHLTAKATVFITSIHQPEQINKLRDSIHKGETVVFIGSSGVGKSSLVNALCNKDILTVSHISDSTGKGRHTSTRREMILLEHLGVLIDTPGVREFGIVTDNTDVLASVLDISDLEGKCRFLDCKHLHEPGCAVLEAVENGTLDRGVYESYLKLRKEANFYATSEYERRQKDKQFGRTIKHFLKLKSQE